MCAALQELRVSKAPIKVADPASLSFCSCCQ